MDISIFIARVAALIYLSIAFALFRGTVSLRDIMAEFKASRALSLLVGYFATILGSLIVYFHNVWCWEWPVLVTLIGWGALIKGVLYMVTPHTLIGFADGMIRHEKKWGVVVLALGLLFGYFGFIAPSIKIN